MRGFWRVPLAAWASEDGTPAFPDLVEADRTTYSVYAVSATDPRPDLAAVPDAKFLGHRLSDVDAPFRKRFVRTCVERVEGEDVVRRTVRPDDVRADDVVLEEGVPAVLFAGDTPDDVR